MCQFISWKEDKKGNVFFLQNEDLKPKKLKEYQEYNPRWKEDLHGHGAIEWFYPELKGKCENKECTDFSTPNNFPKQIVKAIKDGELSKIGYNTSLLNAKGMAEYNKIEQSAWKEYNKIQQPALEEYYKIKRSEWAEYNKIEQPELEEYNKIKKLAWAKYKKIKQQAWVEYKKIEQSALEEYYKIQQSALEEYKKIQQSALWKIFNQKKYRAKGW